MCVHPSSYKCASVSKWELDDEVQDTENVVQLSRIFGVSCDYLLREEVDEPDAVLVPAVQDPQYPAPSYPVKRQYLGNRKHQPADNCVKAQARGAPAVPHSGGCQLKIGEKLQQLRKKSGLTQEQLAARLTVSRQAVSKWELDDAVPGTENVVQLPSS